MQAVVVEGEVPIGVAESSVQFHQGRVISFIAPSVLSVLQLDFFELTGD
jgi:hypothetical protein